MLDLISMSERKACSLVDLCRASLRYQPSASTSDETLSLRICSLVYEHRRFGHRRVHQLLRREGLHANHKRVYRLYREAGLTVRKRARRTGIILERQPLVLPDTANDTWWMDFVMNTLACSR